jgi:carbohydrate diacid regulator
MLHHYFPLSLGNLVNLIYNCNNQKNTHMKHHTLMWKDGSRMKILEHFAQDIAEKTTEILGYPISITDKEGYIIGSTDRTRLGIFHQPSLEVLKKNDLVTCYTQEEPKILPGVSVPLMFNNKPIGVLGIVGDPGDVEMYVHLVKNQVEMMCQEAFRKEVLELESKMVEVFVQQIIHFENDANTDHILQYAKSLGYDLDTSRACLLIDIGIDMNALHNRSSVSDRFSLPYFQREALDFLNLIFRETKNDIVSFLNVERFIIIKAFRSDAAYAAFLEKLEQKLENLNKFLESKYQFSASIAMGDLKKGIRGIAESYRNASKAMQVGKRENRKPQLYLYDDWDITLKLLPKELSSDLRKKLTSIIRPLIEQDNFDILSATFLGYCKHNMNVSETSRSLFIHRNTIIYRLERISELTSLHTGNFEHCMLLYTAIRQYEETKLSTP